MDGHGFGERGDLTGWFVALRSKILFCTDNPW